jgi:hypothetical protein
MNGIQKRFTNAKARTWGSILQVLLLMSGLLMMGGGTAAAQTADVQIIHNSPDPAAATVDIYLGESLAVPDLAFREATGILSLPAGVELQIGVAPGNSSDAGDVIAWFGPTLTAGESYVVMAAGVLDPGLPGNPESIDTSFDLHIFPGLLTSATGGVALLAFHGAPDAPTVDVRAVGVGTLFGGLAFGEFQGYLTVPAASYRLQVTPAGDPGTVVAAFAANLGGLQGGAAVVFASGFLDPPSRDSGFGLFAALPDGSVLPLDQVPIAAEAATWGALKTGYRP